MGLIDNFYMINVHVYYNIHLFSLVNVHVYFCFMFHYFDTLLYNYRKNNRLTKNNVL